ncbi:PTS sugar transporter subunit IIA [Coprothermobacter platensis]|uniref:PTS sugar transporter subunit IIA n=1 Tax=Coprothermobacter platensis TaxID=108819 RepID=UPI0003709D63|nr:PTS sugar transporter subunit IIA [Coprothermobacter platensis]
MLESILTEKAIKLKAQAKDWQEAVRLGGELLVNAGFVHPAYVDAMVETVRELGPYSVISPGIAMPHARPEAGVIKHGLSLLTLATPVEFGNKENDPVDIVVSFCATDNTSHIQMLAELAQLLGSEEALSTIRNAEEVKTVVDLLKSFKFT